MGQKWPDCDPAIREFVENSVQVFKDEIPEKLDAVFLHGSLAMGSFYPPKSDVDLLILAKNPLSVDEQKRIHSRLVEVTDKRPITGFLELSVVSSALAKEPKHPIFYELHYGEKFPEKIKTGMLDYNNAQGSDPDLAAHFMVTKHRGISLYGASPQAMLGDIPWKDYFDAVLDDLNWILDKNNILESPFYGILNCCRFLEMLTKGPGTVSSKEEGALWALENLPAEYHEIINFALDCYKSNRPVSPEQRQRAGVQWPDYKVLAFRDYVRKIRDENELMKANENE